MTTTSLAKGNAVIKAKNADDDGDENGNNDNNDGNEDGDDNDLDDIVDDKNKGYNNFDKVLL